MKSLSLYLIAALVLLMTACASIGSPDGGPYDEEPPHYVGSTVPMGAEGVKDTRIKLHFDEYVALQNASDKVVVSPPQINMPEITAAGKDITVKLNDTLRPNTTYTVDFSDAIVDNNEGNPMGQFTYYFSTGCSIDTLEVSGTVLNAADLEPIKGIFVGLHKDLADSAFTSLPFDRVARTNASGRFTIKGIAAGKYRIFALKDADGDFRFTQKNEMIAVGTTLIEPKAGPDVRTDTIWRDSTHIDSVVLVHYTRFTPDDIVLRAFTETNDSRFLVKTERLTPQYFSLFFTAPSTQMPRIEGINFDADKALLAEPNAKGDTIKYWVRDVSCLSLDTLEFRLTYDKTNDSTLLREQVTDTLFLAAKTTLAKQKAELDKKKAEWQKNKDKAERKGEAFLTPMPAEVMEIRLNVRGSYAPNENPEIELQTPIAQIDTAGIKLFLVEDSIRTAAPFKLIAGETKPRSYTVFGAWRPGQNYELEVDSLTFTDVFGLQNKTETARFSIAKDESFGTLFMQISGSDTTAVVELLGASGNPQRQVRASAQGLAEFYYLRPGKYYVRMFIDANGNGVWDTGEYKTNTQPEMLYYYPQEIDVPAKWDVEQSWSPLSRPLDKQKPEVLIKQKAEKKNEIKKRNAERLRNMQ